MFLIPRKNTHYFSGLPLEPKRSDVGLSSSALSCDWLFDVVSVPVS